MASDGTAPDTIVLIHGFWVTPRRREDWKAYYEGKGYTVLPKVQRSNAKKYSSATVTQVVEYPGPPAACRQGVRRSPTSC